MHEDVAGSEPPEASGPPQLLVVEDDVELADVLRSALQAAGYEVDVLHEGTQVAQLASRREYAAIVLDVLLPGKDGYAVCAALRQRGPWVPVLMLTALGATEQRVRGLSVGADDYLTKPFELAELTARLRALVRMNDAATAQILRYGTLRLEVLRQRCFVDDVPVTLTPREFGVLRALVRRPGIVLTRRTLLEQAWGDAPGASVNALEQTVARLRRKLGVQLVETVHGIGYRLTDPPSPV